MTNQTIHQARSMYSHGGVDHLLIDEQDPSHPVLRMFNNSDIGHRPQVSTFMFMTKEQWQELGEAALAIATRDVDIPGGGKGTYMLSQQVSDWQDANRKARMEKKISEVVPTLLRSKREWYPSSLLDRELVAEMLERGMVEEATVHNQHRIRLTLSFIEGARQP